MSVVALRPYADCDDLTFHTLLFEYNSDDSLLEHLLL